MNLSIHPELEAFVNAEIKSGRYESPEDAVNAALLLLKEREEAESRLETLLQEAEASGPATEMSANDWVEIEVEGMLRSR